MLKRKNKLIRISAATDIGRELKIRTILLYMTK